VISLPTHDINSEELGMNMAASAHPNVAPTASVPPVRSFPFQRGLMGRAISFSSGIESLHYS